MPTAGQMRDFADEPKAEVKMTSTQYQEMKIMSEVLSRFKRQLGGAPDSHAVDDENTFWPSRDVHLGKEFPNLASPINQASLDAGKVGLIEQGAPKGTAEEKEDENDEEGEGEIMEEDKEGEDIIITTTSATPTSSNPPSIGEKVEPAPATDTDGKTLRQRKQEKAAEQLPPWAKLPIAAASLKLQKALSEADLPPSDTFEQLGISPATSISLAAEFSITRPTEIQRLTIPEFAKGSNILCAAQTGTGKTLAYLLPLLEKLHMQAQGKAYKRRGQRTRSLIVVPNRELGLQVLEILRALLLRDKENRFAKYTTLLLSGGADSFKHETQLLTPGVDVLISTPERLVNHIEAEHLHLDDLKTVIFDEADTLMSREDATKNTLQFISFVKESIKQKATLTRVQHVFVSATVSKPLMDLLKREYPDTVSAVSSSIHKSVPSLKQEFLYGAGGDFRFRLLQATLQKRKAGEGRTLIFCNSVHSCKDVFTRLEKKGHSVVMLHSDLDVKRRKKSYEEFMHGNTRIMVATDIASRGLDLGSKVRHVILYDFPTNTIDYLHRIGRTARAGQTGFVTAFVGRSEQRLATLIKSTLESGRSLAEITPTVKDEKRKKSREVEHISEEYRDEFEEEEARKVRDSGKKKPAKAKKAAVAEDEYNVDVEDEFDEDFIEEELKVRKERKAAVAADKVAKAAKGNEKDTLSGSETAGGKKKPSKPKKATGGSLRDQELEEEKDDEEANQLGVVYPFEAPQRAKRIVKKGTKKVAAKRQKISKEASK